MTTGVEENHEEGFTQSKRRKACINKIHQLLSDYNNILKVQMCRSEKSYVLVQSTTLSQQIPLGPNDHSRADTPGVISIFS